MAIFEISSDKIRKIAETTFEEVGIHERTDLQRLLRRQIDVISPDTLIIAEDFRDWEEPDEDRFAQDVTIVLVSAEFAKELTSSVMWLNERDLDIRCIRMKPYLDGDRVFVDVQQVIPLPEVTDYQVQIREKEQRERKGRAERYGIRKLFWNKLLEY